MITAEEIQNLIAGQLPCEYILVRGDDGTHFDAIIVSVDFSGRSRVQRHQLVYQTLGDKMRADIHALSMKTYSPEEWAKIQG